MANAKAHTLSSGESDGRTRRPADGQGAAGKSAADCGKRRSRSVCAGAPEKEHALARHTRCLVGPHQWRRGAARRRWWACSEPVASRCILSPLLFSVLWTCGGTSDAMRPVHIELSWMPSTLQSRSRRQATDKLRCLTATVERPTIGQCIDVFAKPVPLRTCVRNDTEAQARVDLPIVGPSVRLAISDLSPFANLAQNYVNQECRLRWQDWVVPPTFVYTCYGGTKEMQICNGLDDYFTCTLGTCIRLSDRPDWPIDWWERVDPAQFGGDTPLLFDTRQWYCHDSPGYALGEIKIGNLGSQIYYAKSSNVWIKHECDLVDDLGNPLEDPDAQCQNVTAKDPVAKECCGFCILNNAHLMKMWNCTGLRDLIGNTLGINALARYCKVTKGCRETRPCLGDPVRMGDPQVFLDPTTYSVQCDQLDSGCDDAGRCKFRWACDNRIESLRERLGYYQTPAEPSSGTRAAPGALTICLMASFAYLASFRFF